MQIIDIATAEYLTSLECIESAGLLARVCTECDTTVAVCPAIAQDEGWHSYLEYESVAQ